MKKMLLMLSIIVFCLANVSIAEQITIQWDPINDETCTGYIVEQSSDFQTWTTVATITSISEISATVAAPETELVFYRVSATYANGTTAIRTWSGAWFDARLKPRETPSSSGIQ